MSKLILACDMDDTLTRTGAYFNKHLKIHFKNNGMTDEFKWVEENETKLSTMQYPKEISDVINSELIESGKYMLHAEPTALAHRNIMRHIQDYCAKFPGLIELVICSHRGFHQYGDLYTRQWLETAMIGHLFTDIHMLDSRHDPDKMVFLRQKYPNCEILLVDDNPLHDINTVHPHDEDLVVYNKEHQLPGYVNQREYYNVLGLIQLMNSRMERLGYC